MTVCPGPNTLVGLSKPADPAKPFDHDAAIKALLPAYTNLLTQLKALGVPEVCHCSAYPSLHCHLCSCLPQSGHWHASHLFRGRFGHRLRSSSCKE